MSIDGCDHWTHRTVDDALDCLAERLRRMSKGQLGLRRNRPMSEETTEDGLVSYIIIDEAIEERRREHEARARKTVTLYGIQRDDGTLVRERGGLLCLRDTPYHPAALQDGERNVKVKVKIESVVDYEKEVAP